MERIRTHISKAFWSKPKDEIEEACFPVSWQTDQNRKPASLSWFDQLFEGGLILPSSTSSKNRALTMLLTGPPGTGKSTLALELCYQLANFDLYNSLYLTAETNDQWPIQKGVDFGWNNLKCIRSVEDRAKSNGKSVRVATAQWFAELSKLLTKGSNPSAMIKYFNIVSPFLAANGGKEEFFQELFDYILEQNKNTKPIREHDFLEKLNKENVEILVIDSLNCISEIENRESLFDGFSALANSSLKILVVIMESQEQGIDYWSFISDIIIRLDRKTTNNYLVRTIEIVKARYQAHVWGAHQLKFSSPPTKTIPNKPFQSTPHPYRDQGGIFIYPSIPYYLSKYKWVSPGIRDKQLKTFIPSLDSILSGGFPKGRCTGLIGTRGAHKSHLGYYVSLSQLVNDQSTRVLIISLRDDTEMAYKTLTAILENEVANRKNLKLEDFINEDRLEVMYFPPGHITAEEVYHRVFMSVQRLKSYTESSVCVLFNSLDQLAARFPLCAQEAIFVPGMIEMFSAEAITSLFIGVEEKGQPEEQYGLMSMADALISFERTPISKRDYLGHLRSSWKPSNDTSEREQDTLFDQELPSTPRPVVLEVVRLAGGQSAKIGGILELVHSNNNTESESNFNIYGKEAGLCFIPFNPKYKRHFDPITSIATNYDNWIENQNTDSCIQ